MDIFLFHLLTIYCYFVIEIHPCMDLKSILF